MRAIPPCRGRRRAQLRLACLAGLVSTLAGSACGGGRTSPLPQTTIPRDSGRAPGDGDDASTPEVLSGTKDTAGPCETSEVVISHSPATPGLNPGPACASLGEPCDPPQRECCQASGTCQMNLPTPICSGMPQPGGQEETCLACGNKSCRWLDTVACAEYGPIARVCPAGMAVRQLLRCDGTCFVPSQLYQLYELFGCPDEAGTGSCSPSGVQWRAILCCPG